MINHVSHHLLTLGTMIMHRIMHRSCYVAKQQLDPCECTETEPQPLWFLR